MTSDTPPSSTPPAGNPKPPSKAMENATKIKIAVGCVLVGIAVLLVVLNLGMVDLNLIFAKVRVSLAVLIPAVFVLGAAAGFIGGTFWKR